MNCVLGMRQQRASVLVVALLMLLVVSMLAISHMQGVALESRITARRVNSEQLFNLAEAALREAEQRLQVFSGTAQGLSAERSNCTKSNRFSASLHAPLCVLEPMNDQQLSRFKHNPIQFLQEQTEHYDAVTAEQISAASEQAHLAWMPYRGVDPNPSHDFQAAEGLAAFWNIYLLNSNTTERQTLNPEYGAALTGKGTYYFLVTGQANDQVAIQSTVAVSYLGLDH